MNPVFSGPSERRDPNVKSVSTVLYRALMPVVRFTAKHPHTCFLHAEVCEVGGAIGRSQMRKLRHGLLLFLRLHGATHTEVLSIKQTARLCRLRS